MELELPRFSPRSVNTSLQSEERVLPSPCFFPTIQANKEIFSYYRNEEEYVQNALKINNVINDYCFSRSIYFSKFRETHEEAEGLD